MPTAAPRFTPETLRFFRALTRNNRREWFHEHRGRYDAHVHAPMVAIVQQLAADFRKAAPDFVADPKISLFRPWRDTRFSADKKPLKTNVAAVFPFRALGRMQGAGLYFEVSLEQVWIGGGLYQPDAPTLHAVRSHLLDHHHTLTKLTSSAAFKRLLGTLRGDRVSRMPRGFDAEHPAAELIKQKQFLAWREETPEFATRPGFYKDLLATFAAMAPFVAFLNGPIVEARRHLERDPLLFGAPRR